MKKLAVISALVLLAISVHAQQTASSLTWTTFIPSLLANQPIFAVPGLQSQFTPDKAITVTRIEMYTPGVFGFPVFQTIANDGTPCVPPPSIQITDGTHSFTLQFSGSSLLTDSGLLNRKFSRGAHIQLIWIDSTDPGCPPATGGDFVNQSFAGANVVVQYKASLQ